MSKRGKNEGSIFQRADGRWTAVVDLGWVNAKRQRKYFYGTTRAQVQEKLKTALHAQQVGLPLPTERHTVGSWLKSWLEMQKPPALKPKTYAAYEYQTRVHLIPGLGHRDLAKLEPQEIRTFMRTKTDAGLSTKTVRHLRATLRAALNVAVHDGVLYRNVAALAKPPRLQKKPLHVFSQEEAIRFLAAVNGHRLEALFTVALSLGLREGEALGLRWQDIDLETRRLIVNVSV